MVVHFIKCNVLIDHAQISSEALNFFAKKRKNLLALQYIKGVKRFIYQNVFDGFIYILVKPVGKNAESN